MSFVTVASNYTFHKHAPRRKLVPGDESGRELGYHSCQQWDDSGVHGELTLRMGFLPNKVSLISGSICDIMGSADYRT